MKTFPTISLNRIFIGETLLSVLARPVTIATCSDSAKKVQHVQLHIQKTEKKAMAMSYNFCSLAVARVYIYT